MNHEKTIEKMTFRSWFLPICVVFVLVIAMIWTNVYLRSARYAREGDTYFNDALLIEAVSSYETSAHAYTPWNPYVKYSMEKLWEIGERLEKLHSDPTYPLIAYRSLRSSVYAIKSFYTPYKEWIPRCNEKIDELVKIQNQILAETRQNKSVE